MVRASRGLRAKKEEKEEELCDIINKHLTRGSRVTNNIASVAVVAKADFECETNDAQTTRQVKGQVRMYAQADLCIFA